MTFSVIHGASRIYVKLFESKNIFTVLLRTLSWVNDLYKPIQYLGGMEGEQLTASLLINYFNGKKRETTSNYLETFFYIIYILYCLQLAISKAINKYKAFRNN